MARTKCTPVRLLAHDRIQPSVLWVSAAPAGGLLRGRIRQGLPGGVEGRSVV